MAYEGLRAVRRRRVCRVPERQTAMPGAEVRNLFTKNRWSVAEPVRSRGSSIARVS